MRSQQAMPLVSFATALEIVLADARPIERTEVVPIGEADGRVAAADVLASSDVPPFDRAAMDGYAVVAADTTGATAEAPKAIVCLGAAHAGGPAGARVTPGACVAIATGAPMPDGADAVVMVEETSRQRDVVEIRASAVPGQHVGRRAGDMAAGHAVVRAGDRLNPARVGALAAAGLATVNVYARPVVALLSTGDELVPPGQPLGHGQIHDVNRHTLAAIVHRHGGTVAVSRLVPDAMDALVSAVESVGAVDLIVFSGGSSVGTRDLVRDLFEARGQMRFHGIAVRPGKPTAFGRLDGVPAFGMPGNPTSCLSNGYLLLLPYLRKVARLREWEARRVTAPLVRRIASPSDRHQFYTVRVGPGGVEPAFKGSGEITSMADADGYIEIPAGTAALEPGALVTVTLF